MASNLRKITYEEVDIESLEQDAFEAWGYVVLKVRRGDVFRGIRVKITSVPQETIDEIRKKSPRPPNKTVMLDPSMPEAQALGVTTRQKAIIPDYTDDDYRVRQEAYDLSFRREVVGRGVKSELKLKDGTSASTPEQRYKALEERGLSGVHMNEIAQEILQLTQWSEEERSNFLSDRSVPTSTER